eukprot:5599984-Prymnesium_polylepis.1
MKSVRRRMESDVLSEDIERTASSVERKSEKMGVGMVWSMPRSMHMPRKTIESAQMVEPE